MLTFHCPSTAENAGASRRKSALTVRGADVPQGMKGRSACASTIDKITGVGEKAGFPLGIFKPKVAPQPSAAF